MWASTPDTELETEDAELIARRAVTPDHHIDEAGAAWLKCQVTDGNEHSGMDGGLM